MKNARTTVNKCKVALKAEITNQHYVTTWKNKDLEIT